MNHILDIEKQNEELEKLFETISLGNSILFLGAGASIGEKRYLSKEIIEYYEEYLGYKLGVNNITKFVDILSAEPRFDRNHFDHEVEKMLQKYDVTDSHKIMATVPWREIITTNFDLLVERAYDEIKNTPNFTYDLKTIKKQNEYNYQTGRDEIKYIKLNGCISDKSKYPLAFSSDDFNSLKGFYKHVLNDLKNLSDKISLISVGYSFSDEFGKGLLENFDSYNYRDKKWIHNIDPYPNEKALNYYSAQRICIIKCSFNDFFEHYSTWEKKKFDTISRKRLTLTNSKNVQVSIPNKLSIKISTCIKQLNDHISEKYIKEIQYYQGEEPNYQIILRNVDVIKNELLKSVEGKINKTILENHSTIIPAFFLTGGFGIGKSTFALRLIYELSKNANLDLIAFEITDFLSVKKEYFVELFKHCNAKNIVLYCDEVEVESSFKVLLDLRRELSIEQFNDFNLFFIVPIRENIYEKYSQHRDMSKAINIHLDGNLSKDETIDLLNKLKSVNLINFRDVTERDNIIKRIKLQYNSDSFITLLSIITNGSHVNYLISAYNQLSPIAQKAFIYTALIHRYKLYMPGAILKQLLSIDWDSFTTNVIRVEGKGILIQENVNSTGTDPDIYFRTKHPIIAEELIKKLIPNKDKQYTYYEEIIHAINTGSRNSYLLINLLKSILHNEDFSISKINKLYDEGYKSQSDDSYYILNYSINLQHRGTEFDLKKALDLLIYAESLLSHRNHRFIHRRAVINAELARIYYSKEEQLNFTFTYLNEAEELFILKQLLDPFSIYSYEDYIKMIIWELKNINFDTEEDLQKRIQIETLFDSGTLIITDQISKLYDLKLKYATYIKEKTNNKDFKEYLDGLYSDWKLRPYACVLLYYYYQDNGDENQDHRNALVDEMNDYLDNNEVVKFLFKFYGQNLHVPDNRTKLFRLAKGYPIIERTDKLRFHYFKFIAESYNHNFKYGKDSLSEIKSNYNHLNPEFHFLWLDENGVEQIFEGKITKKDYSNYKSVKVTRLQQSFKLIKGNYDRYTIGQDVKIRLHFYLYGLIAEIVE